MVTSKIADEVAQEARVNGEEITPEEAREKSQCDYSLLRKTKLGDTDTRLANYILAHNLYEGGTAQFLKDVFPHLKKTYARKFGMISEKRR